MLVNGAQHSFFEHFRGWRLPPQLQIGWKGGLGSCIIPTAITSYRHTERRVQCDCNSETHYGFTEVGSSPDCIYLNTWNDYFAHNSIIGALSIICSAVYRNTVFNPKVRQVATSVVWSLVASISVFPGPPNICHVSSGHSAECTVDQWSSAVANRRSQWLQQTPSSLFLYQLYDRGEIPISPETS